MRNLLVLLLIASSAAFGEMTDITLVAENLSAAKAAEYGKSDFPQTLLKFKKSPQGKSYKLKVKRKAIRGSYFLTFDEIPRNNLLDLEGEDCGFLLSAEGFLSGEKIDLYVEDDAGRRTDIISFFPRPVITTSKMDNAYIIVELTEAEPFVQFEMYFNGFKEKEKVEFISYSGDEVIKSDTYVQNKNCILLSPSVLGESEGINTVFIKRENGETLKVSLPWGDKLVADMIRRNKYPIGSSSLTIGIGEDEKFLNDEQKLVMVSDIYLKGQDFALAELNFDLGIQSFNEENYEKAILFFEKTVKFNSLSSEAYNKLGCAALKVNRIDLCWLHFRKAVLLQPNNEEYRTNFIKIYNSYIKHLMESFKNEPQDYFEEMIGKPDLVTKQGRGRTIYHYGIIDVLFKNGRMAGILNK